MDLNYIPALHNKVLILHIIALKIVITIFGLHRKHFKKEKNKNLTICRKCHILHLQNRNYLSLNFCSENSNNIKCKQTYSEVTIITISI